MKHFNKNSDITAMKVGTYRIFDGGQLLSSAKNMRGGHIYIFLYEDSLLTSNHFSIVISKHVYALASHVLGQSLAQRAS
ncbi:MAG: hypothetical protein ACKPFK_29840, partial [Dolichospermum sp.]